MTQRAVVALAMFGALLGIIIAAFAAHLFHLSLPVAMTLAGLLQVGVAGSSARWSFKVHEQHQRELRAVGRATVSTRSLMLLEVRRHVSGRWSLSWARGRPLLSFRDVTHYTPSPTETGPCSYWLETWTVLNNKQSAELITKALETGTVQRWVEVNERGNMTETEATRTGADSVLCVRHDVTDAERIGADRGRQELLSVAQELDRLKEGGMAHA